MAWSHGTQNMVVSTGRLGGDVVFSGHGAGGDATAVAVVSDLLAVAQGARSVSLPVTAEDGDGRLGRAALSAVHCGRQAGDRFGDLGCAFEGGSEHRFPFAASRISKASIAVCSDDGALFELDDCGGGWVNRERWTVCWCDRSRLRCWLWMTRTKRRLNPGE